jgi:hypothetical protein
MSELSFQNRLDPEDYYYSDEGYLIFTEQYHKKRGYCCENGCLHCPYGFNKTALKRKEEKENDSSKSDDKNRF